MELPTGKKMTPLQMEHFGEVDIKYLFSDQVFGIKIL